MWWQAREKKKTDTPEDQQLRWSTKINYGIGAMGKSLSNQLTGRQDYFYKFVLHLNLGFLSALYFLGRLWDGVNDLLMGAIIDNTHGRFGKFRPWIALGAVTNALITIVVFWRPGFEGNAVLLSVWVAVFYILWDATYTMVDVGYYAMIPALSMDAKQRDQLSMIPRVFSGVVGIGGAFINKILQTLGGGEEPDDMAAGMFIFAIFSGAIYIFTSLYSAAVVKEPGIDTPKINQEKFTLRQAARILFSNDQALVVVGVMILFNMACNLTNGGSDELFLWTRKDTSTQGFYNILLGAAQGLGLFVFPLFSRMRGIGRSKTYVGSFILPCIGYLAMMIIRPFETTSFIPLAISAFVTYIGYGSMSVMQGVMLADAVDYGEYNTGTRNEGIIFSTLTMLSKLAKAFSDILGTTIASLTKFGGQHSHVVTSLAIRGFKAKMYQIPPILLLLALGLYLWKYRLHPERMDEIQTTLRERKLQEEKDILMAELREE